MRNILIVEDEVYARQSVKKQIQECNPNRNFQVFEAENGRKGLEIFRQEDIGLVFTDIRMPVMDGLELLREIKALRPECRVVMISAYADFEYAKAAMKLGAEEYLLKPISETELRQCLSLKSYEQHRETDTGEDMVTRFIMAHIFSGAAAGEDMLASRMFQKVFGRYQVLPLPFPEGRAPGRESMIRLTQSCGKDEIFTGFRLLNVANNRYVLVLHFDGDTTFLVKRLMARLDLVKYDAPAPLQDECVAVKTVHIPTRQHIGAPAVPCVKAGDVVERGQVVANPAEGLSVAIHASVKGRVREVTAAQIVIDTIGE